MKIDIETKEFFKKPSTTSELRLVRKPTLFLNRLASCCAGCDLAHAAKKQEDGGVRLITSGFQFFTHGFSRPTLNNSLSGNR